MVMRHCRRDCLTECRVYYIRNNKEKMMARVAYDCQRCGEEIVFDTETASQLILDDTVERPVTYVVNCSRCGAQNSVTPNK